MASKAGWIVVPSLLLIAAPAEAHFRLDSPPSSTTQTTDGSPQKPGSATDGCPNGTATGLAQQVRAGGKVTVKITETVPHGGHYRVAFAKTEAAFSFPTTQVTDNQCISTTIAPPGTTPILADGLFAHDQAAANAKNFCNGTATCESEVTIPNVAPGDYIMQVIEWMVPHGSGPNNAQYGCFYTHCATIQVVDADASILDGGVVTVGDAGPSDPGTTNPGSDASTGDGDGDGDGMGGGSNRLRSSSASDDGCGVASANGASLGGPLLFALAVVRTLRRKKKR